MPPRPQEGEATLHLGPRVSTERFGVAPYWTSPGELKADIPFATGAAAGSSGGALVKLQRSWWNSGPWPRDAVYMHTQLSVSLAQNHWSDTLGHLLTAAVFSSAWTRERRPQASRATGITFVCLFLGSSISLSKSRFLTFDMREFSYDRIEENFSWHRLYSLQL